MSVKIRLSRIGKKKEPFFRLVAVDTRRKRDGKYLANIGTYDVLNSALVTFNEDVYKEWIAKGALPTDSAKKIYRIYKRQAEGAPKTTPEMKAEKKAKKAEAETTEKVAAKEAPVVEEKVEQAEEKVEKETPKKEESSSKE